MSNITGDDPEQTFQQFKSDIFTTFCTDVKETSLAEALNQLSQDFKFEHVPSWNETECNEIIGDLLDPTDCRRIFDHDACFDLKTPVKGTAPRQYYAMGAYYWVFGRYLDLQSANMAEVKKKIDVLCRESTEEYQATCFKVTFIYKLL